MGGLSISIRVVPKSLTCREAGEQVIGDAPPGIGSTLPLTTGTAASLLAEWVGVGVVDVGVVGADLDSCLVEAWYASERGFTPIPLLLLLPWPIICVS